MPTGYGSFLAVAALLYVQAVSATPLDDNALRLYGGTYSAKCGDRGYQHLRVLPESVSILRGDKQVATKNIDVRVSYFGQSPPPDFQAALIASINPEFQFTFLIYKDQRGRYIEIDGSPKLLQLLGQKPGDKTRYYECVKIAAATPDSSSTVAPQWKKIDENPGLDIYIDPATVRRTGNLVKLVYLRDNKGKESDRGDRFTVSIVWESEMDCSRRRGRDLRMTGYARPMGSGPSKEAPFSKNWREISDPDEDIAGSVYNFVCPQTSTAKATQGKLPTVAASPGKLPFVGSKRFCGDFKGTVADINIREDGFTKVRTNMWTKGGAFVEFSGKLGTSGELKRSAEIYLEVKSANEIRMQAPQDFITGKPCS